MSLISYSMTRQTATGEKLFVGNLPPNADETEIWAVFAPYGAILEIICLGPNRSKSGQACAFVKFATTEGAQKAAESVDGKVSLRPNELPDLLMQVRPAKASPSNWESGGSKSSYSDVTPAIPTTAGAVRLFVGNLPLDITVQELNDLFISTGVKPIESETFLMVGRSHSNNANCAFVIVRSDDDARRAISCLDGKASLRNAASQNIRVRYAHQTSSAPPVREGVRTRAYSDSFVPMMRPDLHPASAYGSGLCVYATPMDGIPMDWNDPSVKTYHHYMMLPQSSNYGPMNIVPGNEPWRNNGIYSLPPSSFSMYMGR